MAFSACTSARWTVKNEHAVDKSDYEVLSKNRFLKKSGEVSPENPVLRLQLLSRTKLKYPERVLAERTIQEYKLKPGFLALGLSGAAMAFLAANTTFITNKRTQTRIWTLNAVGALLTASGFLNMKPDGDPRPTGEERYLRKSGSVVQIDTTNVTESVEGGIGIAIQFGDITIYEDSSRTFSNSTLEIPLADPLMDLNFTGPNPGNIQVQVTFDDSLYSYQYPVSRILQPYARITSRLAPLRNSPEVTNDNIVADLAEGSQLPISNAENEDWYRVMYGISEHFIPREEAEMVWRTSDFAQRNEIVTVPRIPFGDIDVESNIPILRSIKRNSAALIITNQEYSGNLSRRSYAHRDGRLISTYLQNALGYPKENIFELQDLANRDSLTNKLKEIRAISNSNTEITVYLSGYGSVQDSTQQLGLLGISNEEGTERDIINLENLYERLANITSGQLLILNDIDFSHSISDNYSPNVAQNIIERNIDKIIAGNDKATALFSTHLNQPSSLYAGDNEDKKHYIFPYFFARALQLRKTNMADVYQFLERNVSYTARRLHDRPQDPFLLGNSMLDLQDE